MPFRIVVRLVIIAKVAFLADGFLEFLYLAGADDAVGFVIDVAINLIAFTPLHAHFLLSERAEEVFHESPVKVSTVFVGPSAFEIGKLSHLDEGVFCGGDEALVLVEIEKHVKHIPHLCSCWHIAFRQQDVSDVSAFQINSVVFLTQDFQLIPLAQLQIPFRLAGRGLLAVVHCLLMVVHCHIVLFRL